LNEPVALKFLLPLDNKAAVQRFKREITMNRKLVHPNIVRVFDLGMHEDMRYVTMELLTGEDLWRRRKRPIEMQVTVDVLMQTCRGLHEAHAQGITHRDVKPANIFITTSGVVKVMDFGIARENNAKGLTQTGHYVGTPRYMAPEHFIGDVGPPADLYSVGITAYEVLCGRPPFDDKEALPLMWKHAGEVPVPPIERNRSIPEQLNMLIMKMLEKHPDDRPESAAAAADALQKIHDWLVLNAPTIQEEDELLFSRD
jgi:eukaryotic-like serine/threonine-protein kinase